MTGGFALGSFLARWGHQGRHDLSASESTTLTLSSLLDMAGEDDWRRWHELGLGYAEPHGAHWLRAAIADRYYDLAADNVLCCAGAQEGLACVMRALLAPGDHAVVVVPIYQPSEHAVTSICAATGVPLEEHDGWQLDIARVAAAIRPETRLVLVNFPNSPTGASITRSALAALVALCRRHGLWLVNDEVYDQTGSDPCLCPSPVADIYERGVSINALSKGFGLPGLRVGWVVCQDRPLLAKVLLAKSVLSSCLAGPSEVLAHIALQEAPQIIGRNRAIARANWQCLQAVLCRHPDLFEAHRPGNAVLAFPRYLGADGADGFAVRLVRETGVLVLPSSLWRSPLAAVPDDRLRIGLGRVGAGPALEVMDEYLTRRARAVAAA